MASPASGYPDWQRVVNWDSPIQIAHTDVLGTVAAFQSAIIDVSKYGYLAGQISSLQGKADIQVVWYADAAGNTEVGFREFCVDITLGNPARLNILHLGPYVQVVVNSIQGGAYRVSLTLFSTNRIHALDFIPSSSVIFLLENQALAANAITTFGAIDYYAGPCKLSYTATGNTNVRVKSLRSDGVYHSILEEPDTTNVLSTFDLLLPPGAWLLEVQNLTAAAINFWARITPSLTGAA